MTPRMLLLYAYQRALPVWHPEICRHGFLCWVKEEESLQLQTSHAQSVFAIFLKDFSHDTFINLCVTLACSFSITASLPYTPMAAAFLPSTMQWLMHLLPASRWIFLLEDQRLIFDYLGIHINQVVNPEINYVEVWHSPRLVSLTVFSLILASWLVVNTHHLNHLRSTLPCPNELAYFKTACS